MQITKVTCTELREITFKEYERVIDGWMYVWMRGSGTVTDARRRVWVFAGGGSVGVLTLTRCFHPVQARLIVNLRRRVCVCWAPS